MSKPFVQYQYLEGEPMTKRDEKEKDSKFWNRGKWNTFVEPLLPKDCSDLSLVDVGCNAGLHLQMAKERGFKKVIGVEPNQETYERAVAYRDKHGFDYELIDDFAENTLDYLPIADITLLSNVHYYMVISDWLDYLDELKKKTCYCLIITKEAKEVKWRALASPPKLRWYFRDWDEVGSVQNVKAKEDPAPRPLTSFLFKSRAIESRPIKAFHRKRGIRALYDELDAGKKPEETSYYKYWTEGRTYGHPKQKTLNRIIQKHWLYADLKENGQLKPIIVRSDNAILDGFHRMEILARSGVKRAYVRQP